MKHPFECKHLGSVSDQLLAELKTLALAVPYKKTYSWDLRQSDFLNSDSPEVKQVLLELEPLVKVSTLESAAFSLLPKLTYGPEHSDQWILGYPPTNAKIHIPVITNPFVGFMWPGYDANRPAYVTQMHAGQVYLFNNTDKHSLVNLSAQEDRYHLLLEFREIECVE